MFPRVVEYVWSDVVCGWRLVGFVICDVEVVMGDAEFAICDVGVVIGVAKFVMRVAEFVTGVAGCVSCFALFGFWAALFGFRVAAAVGGREFGNWALASGELFDVGGR